MGYYSFPVEKQAPLSDGADKTGWEDVPGNKGKTCFCLAEKMLAYVRIRAGREEASQVVQASRLRTWSITA